MLTITRLYNLVEQTDSASHSIALLGTLPHPSIDAPSSAIVRIERLPLPESAAQDVNGVIDDADLLDSTDIVSILIVIKNMYSCRSCACCVVLMVSRVD